MAGYRKHPFGYKMEYGQYVLCREEARLVQIIFQQYAAGISYGELTAVLDRHGVSYSAGKPWNKNMVARILDDTRYLGRSAYPGLISENLFIQVEEKRKEKTVVPEKTEAEKVLRHLSNGVLNKVGERQVLQILNSLVVNPQKIGVPQSSIKQDEAINSLQKQMKEALDQQPMDEETVRRLVLALASKRYESIGNQAYETTRLQRHFSREVPQGELDAELLRQTVEKVLVGDGREICLQLKNGQIVGCE